MFVSRLISAIQSSSPLVVGIDPWIDSIHSKLSSDFISDDPERLVPSLADLYYQYGKTIIDAVGDLIPAIKPQSAFFEVLGHHGIKALEGIVTYARQKSLLVIMDVKRGDVPTTADQYARAYLGDFQKKGDLNKNIPITPPLSSDAVTVNPYLGSDSLSPFFARTRSVDSDVKSSKSDGNKGVFVLLKTSNPGSQDLQDLIVDGEPIYNYVIKKILHKEIYQYSHLCKEGYSNIGVVVGATFPETAVRLRKLLPHCFFLVPGWGVQGGQIKDIGNYLNPDGMGALFHFSRTIIYPSTKMDGDNYTWELLKQDIRNSAIHFITKLKKYTLKQ